MCGNEASEGFDLRRVLCKLFYKSTSFQIEILRGAEFYATDRPPHGGTDQSCKSRVNQPAINSILNGGRIVRGPSAISSARTVPADWGLSMS
jgi:hypothetical protein